MARNRFVVPNTVRIELSEDDWIEIKERLTYGEQKRLETGAMGKMTSGGASEAGISLDFERYNLQRLHTWLVAWSFVDENGKRVKITIDSLSALDQESAQEIDDALTAHIEELEERKNVETTPTA